MIGDNLSPMSLDPPQWSPLTEPPFDDQSTLPVSLDQSQADDWIDWMKWDEKDGVDDIPVVSTSPTQPQMLTPESHESEKMSVGSSSPRRSDSRKTLSSPLDSMMNAHLVTPTSTSTVSKLSPKKAESRCSFESLPSLAVTSTATSTRPDFDTLAASRPNRKRKAPPEDARSKDRGSAVEPAESQVAKRPHNMVERRYRNNLNEKIAALRDSVPSLRSKPETLDAEDDEPLRDSSQKLNKGSILSKATEYINHLELRSRRLDEENLALKTRLRKLEKLLEQKEMTSVPIESSGSSYSRTQDKTVMQSPSSATTTDTNRPSSPRGLIPVPESFRRLRPTAPQPHYADSYLRDQNLDSEEFKEGKAHGKLMNRLVIGSLAGLMVMDSFMTKKEAGQRSNVQGLLAIPVDLISILGTWLHLSEASSLFPLGHLHAGLLPVVRFFLALNVLAFIVFVYLFSSKPMDVSKSHRGPSFGSDGLALSSPIQIRRQAWLTSIQTVWVPQHTFLTELIATTLEAFKYFFRYLVGWPMYIWLTGWTEDDEIARRKALDILLDAQLTGGDHEISRSRLVLTIFASGTLPNTPARLMVKALHARIILWRVGRSGSLPCRLADAAAKKVARYQWALAQRLAASPNKDALFPDEHDPLPPHLANLLHYGSDQILNDSIIQRAYNLAWLRPASEGVKVQDGSMDMVGEDVAVRSPLDAVAAWWSTIVLNKALLASMASDIGDKELESLLEEARGSAPPTSVAQSRAHAANAIFLAKERTSLINHLLDALPPYKSANIQLQSSPYVPATNFFTTEMPAMARDEVRHVANCAIVIALIVEGPRTSFEDELPTLLQKSLISNSGMTLLNFIASRQLLNMIRSGGRFSFPRWEAQTSEDLRKWADDAAAKDSGEKQQIFWRITEKLAHEQEEAEYKRMRRLSNDTGYETQSDSY